VWSSAETWNGTQFSPSTPFNSVDERNPQVVTDWQRWAAGVPSAGDNVWIPSSYTVLLDVSPPPLHRLIVEGTLVFNRSDLRLDAVMIEVRGGTLRIGSADAPFTQHAVITLLGDRSTPWVVEGKRPVTFEPLQLGAKALVVTGKLELYGAPRTPAWTTLALPAAAGDTSITVGGFVDWRVGDQLVLAPTGFDPWEVCATLLLCCYCCRCCCCLCCRSCAALSVTLTHTHTHTPRAPLHRYPLHLFIPALVSSPLTLFSCCFVFVMSFAVGEGDCASCNLERPHV
jgi:hypothetical protein